jgi:AcrR family transcriptional regulator
MSLIADEAGVGMGTIYHYFPGKEDMVNVLYRELKAIVHRAMLSGYDRQAPARDRFFKIWRNLFHLYLDKPDLYRFLERYSQAPVINQESRDLGLKLWEEPIQLIEQAQAQRIVKDLPLKVLMLIGMAPLNSLVQGHLSGYVSIDEATIEAAITACWDAIKL